MTTPTPAAIAASLTEEDDDGPCTDCEDTGWTFQTERPCTCEFGLAVRAHLEKNDG
ncbi:hypothetical protein UFOVP407_19 [uncultured Caudovirales phage]|uniref:Uncharacterized protein n=1 Tax=uncultured Caudovirales phage TaxID=2100421 RepID=A0A6J5M1R9_9CAUD|nr:hypothetical protein UFOVP407_19 [uncultured Caudovirales phage]